MAVPLPAGEPCHARRLALITERKKNPRAQITSGIFRFILAWRAFNLLLPHQRYLNIFVTNVPGPPAPLYLAGAPLLEVFPVLAITGNMALGAAVMSYAGQLNLTAVADRDHCPDVEVFAEGVRRSLDDLAQQPAHPGQADGVTCRLGIRRDPAGNPAPLSRPAADHARWANRWLRNQRLRRIILPAQPLACRNVLMQPCITAVGGIQLSGVPAQRSGNMPGRRRVAGEGLHV